MSNADRIEELRSKYEENPRRYFAPLANEYRKAGDLAQAIAICREHLPKQPGHMSGYIVYGQTLFEANNLEEARTVFEQALALDPENLIALKHLGDIARMNGENGVARRWYARVLDADPRNDDIASQLASLGAPTPIAPIPAIPEPPQHSEPQSGGEAVGVFATFDPSSLLDVPEDVAGIAGGREFWTPAAPEPRAALQHEPLDLDFPESPEPVAEEESFEEGILAPEWPDTSELVARVVTPFHSATPISVPATPDTLAAFGRESFDSVETTPMDLAPADELVEAFLPPEPVSRAAMLNESAQDEPVEFADTEFETNEFEVTSLDALSVEQSLVEQSAVEATDLEQESVVASADAIAEELDVEEFVAEEFVAEEFVVDTAASVVSAQSIDVAEETAVTSVPNEELFWADEVVTTTDDDQIEHFEVEEVAVASTESAPDVVAETVEEFEVVEASTPESRIVESEADVESLVTADAEDLSFAGALPWEQQPSAELAVVETAEFAIPEELRSGAHNAFAEVEQLQSDVEIESEAVAEPVVNEVADEPVEEVVAQEVVAEQIPEESFAEVSSQLEAERATPFVTETMAELLVAQGFLPRAIEVYDELVRRRPHDPVLVSRLAELRALHEAEELPSVEAFTTETVAASATPHFNTPLRNTPLYMTPQYNTPQYTTPTHNTPHFSAPLSATPLSATPAMVSSLGETDSTLANASERHAADRLQAFRTARERFAELSRRRVARRTPTHATAVADDAVEGLSSLFGTAVPATTDELAARALADAFGPVQDSGESLFDPAPTPTPSLPMRSLTPRSTTPVYTPATPDSRSDKQGSDRQPSADYSFDRFFPDPAIAVRDGQSMQTAAPASNSSQPVNEDLAQFSAWLKGLNNA